MQTEEATADSGRNFPCESCGADMVFHIGAQKLRCTHCGDLKELAHDEIPVEEQDYAAMLERIAELREGGVEEKVEFHEVHCNACGATVRFEGTLTSSECVYCGIPLQRDAVHDAEDRIAVDGVLPFKIERAQAHANLRNWVRARWFAPNTFRSRSIEGRFNGIYVPFWTFDSMTSTSYRGMRGEHYWVNAGSGKNRRRQRRTRWHPASGSFQQFFDDILVPAAEGMLDSRIRELTPWPFADCVRYKPELLAGFMARTYDLDLPDGFVDAQKQIDAALRVEVRRRIGGDAQQITELRSRHDAVTYKHLLLPVWMLAYRYRNKTYQLVINATTGEIQGDRPYSWVKIGLAVIAGLLLALLIFLLAR